MSGQSFCGLLCPGTQTTLPDCLGHPAPVYAHPTPLIRLPFRTIPDEKQRDRRWDVRFSGATVVPRKQLRPVGVSNRDRQPVWRLYATPQSEPVQKLLLDAA